MFLNTNDRIINLKNVSNINIVRDSKKRIIFNLNYSISMFAYYNDKPKFISDYVYWDALNTEDLLNNIEYIHSNEYLQDNFIEKIDGGGYININEISSVKFSDKKYRVIFNLSHPVTFKDHDGNERITSEFVYVNCRSYDKYTEYVEYINDIIRE